MPVTCMPGSKMVCKGRFAMILACTFFMVTILPVNDAQEHGVRVIKPPTAASEASTQIAHTTASTEPSTSQRSAPSKEGQNSTKGVDTEPADSSATVSSPCHTNSNRAHHITAASSQADGSDSGTPTAPWESDGHDDDDESALLVAIFAVVAAAGVAFILLLVATFVYVRNYNRTHGYYNMPLSAEQPKWMRSQLRPTEVFL